MRNASLPSPMAIDPKNLMHKNDCIRKKIEQNYPAEIARLVVDFYGAFGGRNELRSKFGCDATMLFGSPCPEFAHQFLCDSETMTAGVLTTPKCKRGPAPIPIVGVELLRKHSNNTRKKKKKTWSRTLYYECITKRVLTKWIFWVFTSPGKNLLKREKVP